MHVIRAPSSLATAYIIPVTALLFPLILAPVLVDSLVVVNIFFLFFFVSSSDDDPTWAGINALASKLTLESLALSELQAARGVESAPNSLNNDSEMVSSALNFEVIFFLVKN